jgi:hypothetical protein
MLSGIMLELTMVHWVLAITAIDQKGQILTTCSTDTEDALSQSSCQCGHQPSVKFQKAFQEIPKSVPLLQEI